MVRLALAMIALGLGLGLPAAAGAQAPHEPNDTREQAAGPLASGTTVTGVLETQADQDWFRIDVPAGRAWQIAVTGTESACFADLAVAPATVADVRALTTLRAGQTRTQALLVPARDAAAARVVARRTRQHPHAAAARRRAPRPGYWRGRVADARRGLEKAGTRAARRRWSARVRERAARHRRATRWVAAYC